MRALFKNGSRLSIAAHSVYVSEGTSPEGSTWTRVPQASTKLRADEVLQAKLRSLGVRTCAQLLQLPPGTLSDKLGPKVAGTLLAFARGVDQRPWEAQALRRSVGAQASWGVRFSEDREVHHFAAQLCSEVGRRLSSYGVRGRMLTVQLWRAVKGAPSALAKGGMGHGLCDKLSRSMPLPAATADVEVLTAEAMQAGGAARGRRGRGYAKEGRGRDGSGSGE